MFEKFQLSGLLDERLSHTKEKANYFTPLEKLLPLYQVGGWNIETSICHRMDQSKKELCH